MLLTWPFREYNYYPGQAQDELRCVWVTFRPQRPSLVRKRAMPKRS